MKFYLMGVDDMLSENWLNLSNEAKMIFPVLAVHSYKEFWGNLTELTLRERSGIDLQKIAGAVTELDNNGFIKSNVTSRTGYGYKYEYSILKRSGTKPFYKKLVTSGLWANLTPSARLLYIALLVKGKIELKDKEEIEPEDIPEIYKKVKYSICIASAKDLQTSAGISKQSYYNALALLKEKNLIEEIEKGIFKVWKLDHYGVTEEGRTRRFPQKVVSLEDIKRV